MPELWTDPFNTNLKEFESQLRDAGIEFTSQEHPGDESTCFYPGVVYTFKGDVDKIVAENIYYNL